jgi:hypothetical protein
VESKVAIAGMNPFERANFARLLAQTGLVDVWRKANPGPEGGYERYAAPLASGLIAGEAVVGSILMPALAMLLELIRR